MLAIKPVVIMGATGTGKTKLSIDISRVIGGEVINADKMQIYAGLDITTNKVHLNDQYGIPHHLIGSALDTTIDLPVSFFRPIATTTAKSIVRRGRIPVQLGGSNSLIHGFLIDRLDPSIIDPFAIDGYRQPCGSQAVSYGSMPKSILNRYLSHRVDDMVDAGLVEEVKDYFGTVISSKSVEQRGLATAIGVRELGEYFAGRKRLCDCIDEMKSNTYALAKAQAAKIQHIVDVWGWPVCSLDATETIRAHLTKSNHTSKSIAWQRDVSGPGLTTINEFLNDLNYI